MYHHRLRFLFSLLLVVLLCSSVQATDLLISVQDSLDNTSIPQATVFVNGANYALTNNNGQVLLSYAGVTDQDIKVSMGGYSDWEQVVDVNTTLLRVNLTRKTLTLTVDLYDSDTLNPITGANITVTAVNTSQIKKTDASGSAAFAVNGATLYSVDISAPNYKEYSDVVGIGSTNQVVQYKLLSGNSFSFVVKDKDTGAAVSGAQVQINSVLAGQTDNRGILITPVTRGQSYTIEVDAPGYATYTETQPISSTDAIDSIVLTKSPVGVNIYVTDENKMPLSGADIYINGTLSGTSNDYGRLSFPNLVVGGYLIEARKSGYVSQSQTITASAQSQDYSIILPFENAATTIFVKDQDQKIVPNATVVIDGNPAGVTDANGQLTAAISFNTPVNITVSKDGYPPVSVQKEVIQGNSTASVTIVLVRNLDWGLISMIVMGLIGVLILFAAIRMFGRRKHRHVVRRNEI
jgi:hypothetical protein